MPGLGITSEYDILHFMEDYMPGLGITSEYDVVLFMEDYETSQVSMI